MAECFFVTGTDTEVGKTIATVALLQAARKLGFIAIGYKPVATGSQMTSSGFRNQDALILQRNSSLKLPYESINPYVFSEPTSPHIISTEEKNPIKFSKITQGLQNLKKNAEWVLIEGAGGWFTPLTETRTFSDWVKQEKLRVILVVGIKLGCINHAILTEKAITQSNLHLIGWIANDVIKPINRHKEYLSTLKLLLSAPFLGEIPWLSAEEKEKNTGQYLTLTSLYKEK